MHTGGAHKKVGGGTQGGQGEVQTERLIRLGGHPFIKVCG